MPVTSSAFSLTAVSLTAVAWWGDTGRMSVRKVKTPQTTCTLVWGNRGDVNEKTEDVTDNLHLGVGKQRGCQ